MRVIGGEFRSRRLKSMHGMDVRPTPDRLRETLFDILATRIEDTVFLDAYAGTGAVGIEALSRGARRALFVERSRGAVDLIRRNLDSLGLRDRVEVYCGKAASLLTRLNADIAFLDPPYALEGEYASVMQVLGERPIPLVIVQHASRFKLGENYGNLARTRVVKQGDNSLSFFEPSLLRPADQG
jgi:16S rRNA (guanine(966)-N(2))-methyltransferase RsmD